MGLHEPLNKMCPPACMKMKCWTCKAEEKWERSAKFQLRGGEERVIKRSWQDRLTRNYEGIFLPPFSKNYFQFGIHPLPTEPFH